MASSPEAAGTRPSLVVIAWGNESRGDDGAGPEIARRLRALGRVGLVVVEDMQLQIEHTADLVAGVPALFVDASVALSAGFALERLESRADPSVTTHALSPSALLRLYETTMGRPAPPAWQLHVAGHQFELGETPGCVSRAAIDAAWRFLETLVTEPRDEWQRLLAAAGNAGASVRPKSAVGTAAADGTAP